MSKEGKRFVAKRKTHAYYVAGRCPTNISRGSVEAARSGFGKGTDYEGGTGSISTPLIQNLNGWFEHGKQLIVY